MCMCLGGSGGACIRGGNKDYCPASVLSAGNCGCRLTASRWNVERPKQEPKLPLFHPLPFCGGREKSAVVVALQWLGFGSLSARGGRRRASRQRECVS